MLNSKGLGLVEIVIGIGLLITIILFTVSLLKQSSKKTTALEKAINITNLEKSIAAHIFSEYGCRQLRGVQVGQSFSIKKTIHNFDETSGTLSTELGDDIFKKGMVVNEVSIDDMRLDYISQLTMASDSAIAKIILDFSYIAPGKKREKMLYSKEVLVPVGLDANGLVSDCQLDKKVMYDYLVTKLCTEPFGDFMQDKKCDDAIKQVELKIKESICIDLTGSLDNFDYSKGFCNLAGSYAGKTCPSGTALFGFREDGELLCK